MVVEEKWGEGGLQHWLHRRGVLAGKGVWGRGLGGRRADRGAVMEGCLEQGTWKLRPEETEVKRGEG
jgi:hypothetical protein